MVSCREFWVQAGVYPVRLIRGHPGKLLQRTLVTVGIEQHVQGAHTLFTHAITQRLSAERHAPRERPAKFHANPISRLYCSSQHPRRFSVAVLFASGSHSQPPKMEPQTHAIARPSICNKPVRSNSSTDSHEQFRIDGGAYNLFSISQNLCCITTSW